MSPRRPVVSLVALSCRLVRRPVVSLRRPFLVAPSPCRVAPSPCHVAHDESSADEVSRAGGSASSITPHVGLPKSPPHFPVSPFATLTPPCFATLTPPCFATLTPPCFATLTPPCFATLTPANPSPCQQCSRSPSAAQRAAPCGESSWMRATASCPKRSAPRAAPRAAAAAAARTTGSDTTGISSTGSGTTGISSTGSGTTGISSTGSGTTGISSTGSGTTESGTGNQATSVLSSQTNTSAKFNVDVNITSAQQRALFTFTVKAVPRTRAPVFSNSSYHTNTGQLVATFACVPKPTTTLGTYRCTASSLANITVPFRPVNRPKALVDAGFFSNPTAFYSTIKVNGITLRGSITASVANL
ncbi:unnamed protein product [Closterium sp. Naga37s-1]|nr:unnamed protein product [Closterium sp. Naga37s-1]